MLQLVYRLWDLVVQHIKNMFILMKIKDIDTSFLDWKVRNLTLSDSRYILYEGIDLKDMRFVYGKEAKLSRKFIK